MILSIDPDVFNIAQSQSFCQIFLINLHEKATEYQTRFAVDSSVIELEYADTLDSWVKFNANHEITKLIQLILEDENLRYRVTNLVEATDPGLLPVITRLLQRNNTQA